MWEKKLYKDDFVIFVHLFSNFSQKCGFDLFWNGIEKKLTMTTVVNKNPPNVYIFTDLYRYLPLERGGEEHDEDDHNEGHIATQNQQKVGVILRGHPGWAALHTRRNKQSINPAVAHPDDGFPTQYPMCTILISKQVVYVEPTSYTL